MSHHHDEQFDWEERVGALPLRMCPRNRSWSVWAGYLVSQLAGFVTILLVIAVCNYVDTHRPVLAVRDWLIPFMLLQLFFVPFEMGFVAAYFWLDTDQRNINAEVNHHIWRDRMEKTVWEGNYNPMRPESSHRASTRQKPRFWGGSALLGRFRASEHTGFFCYSHAVGANLHLICACDLVFYVVWSLGGRPLLEPEPFLVVKTIREFVTPSAGSIAQVYIDA